MRRHETLPEDADWKSNCHVAMDWLQITADDLEQWDEQLRPLLDDA
jgi:hypothetical protein